MHKVIKNYKFYAESHAWTKCIFRRYCDVSNDTCIFFRLQQKKNVTTLMSSQWRVRALGGN